MRILEHRALRGPNAHSRHPAIHMLLDIGGLEERPSDAIPGFTRRLLALLPSLREHHCSPGRPGGFVERLERGTWAAHIVEHVAIELQVLAGAPVGFGKTRMTDRHGVYTVAYRYRHEEVGLQAGRDAVELVDAAVEGRPVDVDTLLARLRRLRDEAPPGPFAHVVTDEARRRGVRIVAVTGTNGKTTTVRLIGHVLRSHGARVGLATTDGVVLEDRLRLEGDYSGPSGAEAVLTEPTVDHAVLEVARGGILRRGLGFEACDVGVVLNVASDHLGEGGVETLEDLARVKGVVAEAAREDGAVVLNAEDPATLAMRARVRARDVLLFALDSEHPALRDHVEEGGVAVTVLGDRVTLLRGASRIPVVAVADMPLAMGGKAWFNVQNALAAVAATHALGVPAEAIGAALATFAPDDRQLPGRMNLFEMDGFRVLVDYGHNVAALAALGSALPHLSQGRRINVANSSGNRRDEDLRAFGRALAATYHHVLLSDPDPRGRPPGETSALVRQGLLEAGFPERNVQTAADEETAIGTALAMAREGDLVVVQADDVQAALRQVRAWQARGREQKLPSLRVNEP